MTPELNAINPDTKPACPMARLAEWIVRAAAIVEGMDDEEADEAFVETMAPLWTQFFDRTPETRSTAGAVAALRARLLSDELDAASEGVVHSVLRHLESQPCG